MEVEQREAKQIISFINNNGNSKLIKLFGEEIHLGPVRGLYVKMLLNKSEDLTVVCLDTTHTHTHTHTQDTDTLKFKKIHLCNIQSTS